MLSLQILQPLDHPICSSTGREGMTKQEGSFRSTIMSNFRPVHFVPANRQAEMLALPVLKIFAVPHQQQAGTNHWCFYLMTSSDTSVQIDCQPSYTEPSSVLRGGSKANLVVSELSCLVPNDAQERFELDITPGLLVGQVYDLIIQNARHKYEFDMDGVGCRCWATGQLGLFHQAQIITNESQVAATKAAILKLWPEQTPLPLDQGAYYP